MTPTFTKTKKGETMVGERRQIQELYQTKAAKSIYNTMSATEEISHQISDTELIARFRQESSRNYAFNLLIKKYQQRVYQLVRKMVIDHDDADDLTQEVFIKVWNNLQKFREESQLYTWIYRIATNECLSFLSRKKRKYLIPIYDVSKELAQKLETSKDFTGDEIQLRLQKALLKLPDKQRLVFNMKYFEDLSYEEISRILGTSVGALKASYHHAVKKIEDFINE